MERKNIPLMWMSMFVVTAVFWLGIAALLGKVLFEMAEKLDMAAKIAVVTPVSIIGFAAVFMALCCLVFYKTQKKDTKIANDIVN